MFSACFCSGIMIEVAKHEQFTGDSLEVLNFDEQKTS